MAAPRLDPELDKVIHDEASRALELWQRIAAGLGLPVVSAEPEVRSGL